MEHLPFLQRKYYSLWEQGFGQPNIQSQNMIITHANSNNNSSKSKFYGRINNPMEFVERLNKYCSLFVICIVINNMFVVLKKILAILCSL